MTIDRLRPALGAIATGAMILATAQTAQAQPGGFGTSAIGEGPWDIATEKGTVRVSLISSELESPWSLVFLPDGGILLTERVGRLRVVRNGELEPGSIAGIPDLDNQVIGGLMGLALHPDFEDNDLIYFSYTKPNPANTAETALAVARARWDGGDSLDDVEDIFIADTNWYSGAIADSNDRCCGQGPAPGSFGARMDFGPDGKLYVSVGDRNWGEEAQNTMSFLGKILRLNDDGSVPDDNPFVGMDGYLPEIYSFGHRNPTGLRFDSETGILYSTEFGPAGGDEVNRIVAGGNYGWMLMTRGEHYDGTETPLGSGDVEGYIDPIHWWPRGGNPGNLIVYRGDAFPAWQGDMFVASMAGSGLSTGLVRLTVDGDGNITHSGERMLSEIGQRFRDVAEGPDGRIYVLTETSPMASAGALIVLESLD